VVGESQFGEHRQLPEAWVGNLETARLLILSSNPTISSDVNPKKQELFPLGQWDLSAAHPDWSEDRVIDFQLNRFDQQRAVPFVSPDARYLTLAGTYSASANRYWKQSFTIGLELFGREFRMDRDILLTEVVHCKSRQAKGVAGAAPRCSDRYLVRILDLSAARLIVVAGAHARDRIMEIRGRDSAMVWEMEDSFGSLPKSKADADQMNIDDRRAQLGLLHLADRSIPLVALQQLSMASNPCRTLTSLLGPDGVSRLSRIVGQEDPTRLRSMSQSDLASEILP
jgi:hypothetical protein